MGANATTFVPAYVSGEVLTAADLTVTNSGIPVFADSTARTAGFGGSGEKVLAEGQFAYLESDNITYYYDGAAWQPVATSGLQVASFTEYQASGTAGGTSTTGSFLKRILNTTLTNTITGCTLTSSVIALPAGTYSVVASSAFIFSQSTQIRLQNTSDASTAISGIVTFSNDANNDPTAVLAGTFTIAATKNFELQYRVERGQSSDGLGRNLNYETNCFSTIQIQKVA